MSFESLVAKLMKEGKSRESAEKIAGSVANDKMKGAGTGPTSRQKARSAAKQTKDMKTNQDGGGDSSTEAADQLKKLGSPTKRMNKYEDKKASMDDYSHEKKLGADGRDELEKGDTAAADNDFDHAHALKDDAHYDHMNRKSFATQFNEKSPMARLKSPAYKHGAMKGDQSATHLDYANYKGTDKGYHGHTGSSHGDQSATNLDYTHPVHKHSRRNKV